MPCRPHRLPFLSVLTHRKLGRTQQHGTLAALPYPGDSSASWILCVSEQLVVFPTATLLYPLGTLVLLKMYLFT